MATTVGALRRSIEGLPDEVKVVVLFDGRFCYSPQIHIESTKKTKAIVVLDCEDIQTFWKIEE